MYGMCAGVHGCAQVCASVSFAGVHGCEWVCMAVCAGACGYVWNEFSEYLLGDLSPNICRL